MSGNNVVLSAVEWFPLPPFPTGNPVVNSVRSLDGLHIFAIDAEQNGSVFSFNTLTWSDVNVYDGISFGGNYGLIMSQVLGTKFNLITTRYGSNSYLCDINLGIIKAIPTFIYSASNPSTIIYSSDFGGYLNTGFQFPCLQYLYNATCFYVKGLDQYVWYVLNWSEGPTGSMAFAVDILTGLPRMQFNNASQFTSQGEMLNNGSPETFAIPTSNFYESYNAGGTWFNAADLAKAIQNAGTVNLLGTITYDGTTYQCPTVALDMAVVNEYEITGFFGSINDIAGNTAAGYAGGVAENYIYLLNQNGVAFTYTPISYLNNDRSGGEFGLGISLPPPEPIPSGTEQIYATRVSTGNVYGYFLADFSKGWYLSIGQYSFGIYNLLNYQRADA
jgi:hypothetical protein